MIRSISQAAARDGAAFEIAAIEAPEPAALAELCAFYVHKPEIWHWPIEAPLRGMSDGLGSRFYVARAGGRIVSSLVIHERWGIGLLAHVYTVPDWRGRGVASQTVGAACEDFDSRGGRAIFLGTTYGSSAYRIYCRLGFECLQPESSRMVRAPGLDWRAELFAPGEAEVEPLHWGHYPLLNALAATPGSGMRSRLLSETRASDPHGGFERAFLLLYPGVLHGPAGASVLVCPGRCAAGWATLAPRYGDGTEGWLFDIHVHSNFRDKADELARSLPLGEKKEPIYAYATSELPERPAQLERMGFKVDIAPREWQDNGGRSVMWTRYLLGG